MMTCSLSHLADYSPGVGGSHYSPGQPSASTWIGSAWLLSLKLSSCFLRKVWYPSFKCLLNNAESSQLTECFSLYNVHPGTHAHLSGSCGMQQKCKRAKMSQGKKNWLSLLPCWSQWPYILQLSNTFWQRGYSFLLISCLWFSLVEPNQTLCVGSILALHSKVRAYLLLEEWKKVNFQRQSCFITPPIGVKVKLFQICRKQGTEQPADLGLQRQSVLHLHYLFGSRGDASIISTSAFLLHTSTVRILIGKDLQWSRWEPLV